MDPPVPGAMPTPPLTVMAARIGLAPLSVTEVPAVPEIETVSPLTPRKPG